MKAPLGSVGWLGFLLLSACGGGPLEFASDDEAAGRVQSELRSRNSLLPNGLTPNGLTPNGLTPNGLTPNALAPEAISTHSLAAIQDPGLAGYLSRMFVQYAVVCAFTESQSFAFSWTDADGVVQNEMYWGHLGLAPSWASGPLDDAGQQRVSACLAAHTNYFGASVTVSMRSPCPALRDRTSQQELQNYPRVEGAFWGNLFATTPRLYACYKEANFFYSMTKKRECATGHYMWDSGTNSWRVEECGIIDIVGQCEDRCQYFNSSEGYYPSCRESYSSNWTSRVITTALP